MSFTLVVQATELAALVSRVTTSEKEVQEQKKELTSHREELNVSKTELQLTKNKLDEIQGAVSGIFIHTYNLL